MATGTESRFQEMNVRAAQFLANGVPLYPAGFPNLGTSYFVDAKNGSDNHDGSSWETPFLTMGAAFDVVKSGDRIYFVGKIAEQLVSPAGVFDVTVIGAGNMPRHADDHTESSGKRGSSAATWTAPASGSTATALLRVQQQGWQFHNIVWQISGSATFCAEKFSNGSSGDDERNGGHAAFFNCRFVGSGVGGVGAQRTGGNGYVRYVGCGFQNLDTGIGHTAGGGGQDGFQLIEDCWFEGNTKHIDSPLYRSRVVHNMFGELDSGNVEVDLTGGQGNIVTNNYFLGGGFEENIAGTGDLWFPNWSVDVDSADVDADGAVNAAPNGS